MLYKYIVGGQINEKNEILKQVENVVPMAIPHLEWRSKNTWIEYSLVS